MRIYLLVLNVAIFSYFNIYNMVKLNTIKGLFIEH